MSKKKHLNQPKLPSIDDFPVHDTFRVPANRSLNLDHGAPDHVVSKADLSSATDQLRRWLIPNFPSQPAALPRELNNMLRILSSLTTQRGERFSVPVEHLIQTITTAADDAGLAAYEKFSLEDHGEDPNLEPFQESIQFLEELDYAVRTAAQFIMLVEVLEQSGHQLEDTSGFFTALNIYAEAVVAGKSATDKYAQNMRSYTEDFLLYLTQIYQQEFRAMNTALYTINDLPLPDRSLIRQAAENGAVLCDQDLNPLPQYNHVYGHINELPGIVYASRFNQDSFHTEYVASLAGRYADRPGFEPYRTDTAIGTSRERSNIEVHQIWSVIRERLNGVYALHYEDGRYVGVAHLEPLYLELILTIRRAEAKEQSILGNPTLTAYEKITALENLRQETTNNLNQRIQNSQALIQHISRVVPVERMKRDMKAGIKQEQQNTAALMADLLIQPEEIPLIDVEAVRSTTKKRVAQTTVANAGKQKHKKVSGK